MLKLENSIKSVVEEYLLNEEKIQEKLPLQFQKTRKDFEGDITLVVFPFVKALKCKPEEAAEKIGNWLQRFHPQVEAFNVVKGFLNLVIADSYWLQFFNEALQIPNFGFAQKPSGKTIMVEYSSPNTNKPLHLGHLRNNFLGYSVAEIQKANGHEVKKVQIINDRGIHICKSMVAWLKFGEGETPNSSGKKGDKLVGDYYVKFDQVYKEEIAQLIADGKSEDDAKREAPIMQEAQDMLRKWESDDKQVRNLWQKMNGWVYDGFESTYTAMGVDFDKLYYESDTYLLGRDEVIKGLEAGVFFKKEDGSIWVDLTDEGMDQKLLLRADGTAVYMTQDIGTAILRFKDFPNLSQIIYTVGNEQDYHFKVLFKILSKLGFKWADNCYHLSYGMVDLPSGKMKSREGTVVDADDLMENMKQTAQQITEELGKLDDLSSEQKEELYHMLGMGALKYFLLKVDPKKRLLFDPAESVEFNGNTGPFIQYTHARINSLLVKSGNEVAKVNEDIALSPIEKELIKTLAQFSATLNEAGETNSPALLANYCYELVKQFNSFYQSTFILKEENQVLRHFKLALSKLVGQTIKLNMRLLGVHVPDRM